MASNVTKLRNLLAELFMFEFADLDFGIYRIMNSKRTEIQRFLDEDLLPQVQAELGNVKSGERTGLEAELTQALQQAKELGADPEQLPKVKVLRERLLVTYNPSTLEDEVFSQLATFFRRYYKDGDYLALRRYKKDVYALPYEGEEVKLHWANADQYYIKSSEHFRDYVFKLPDGRRVHFKLSEADSEENNNKATNGKDRRFVLWDGGTAGRGDGGMAGQGDGGTAGRGVMQEVDGELVIHFAYRPNEEKQATLNRAAAAKILELAGVEFTAWLEGLQTKAPTEKDAGRTLLEKHLGDYAARHSFDYFIHKDLRGFLRRELDFFIKSEVMLLDDIEEDSAPRVEQYLAKVRAMRRIAHKVIDMLAQLEEFQKKLWLKKKFVVATNYCVTLDRVPEELYAAIAANEAQREEWVRLFAIDEIVNTTASPNYSAPLTVDFLKANPFLVLDTQFFTPDFKTRLLASFDDLDAQLDGLLIHSDNFQALNLLQERYRGQVQCIFIDPPYNIGEDQFPYKDNYKHSSWLAMMNSAVVFSRNLLCEEGSFYCCIDDSEIAGLRMCLDGKFGVDQFLASIIWQKVFAPKPAAKTYSTSHDYLLTYAKDIEKWHRRLLPRTSAQDVLYTNPDNDPRGSWASDNLLRNEHRDNGVYSIVSSTGKVWTPRNGTSWRHPEDEMQRLISSNQIWFGPDGNSKPRRKKFLSEVQQGLVPETLWEYEDVGHTQDAKRAIIACFGSDVFPTPKPAKLIERACRISCEFNNLILDFFAGSGTTAHAVINLNREDGGQRKYILVEMGTYFNTVLKPRILKVIYSKDWKDGKPVSRAGSSHLLKYIRLESYEDALNNLDMQRSEFQAQLLADEPELREDYMLRYMLDTESRGSASLLNIDAFANPFAYTLKIANGSVGETRTTSVDLVETFNYLLGLRVRQIDTIRGTVVVKGLNPEGQRVLIIWRDVAQLPNEELDTFFQKQGYTTRDHEFDLIYVNGDNNLENLRRDDETWKVRLTEEEFKRLMFDVRDV
ncbi:MAG: site-specific DNA-methyltransferase [Candidatus Viridilinea halotolerans]|uniref:Site-specific DNA-methyltransferase n=1 Tax=Candidatus Viridilinea halotolerans TaxID=2491704 RepID=A0A426U199_9CHLR|nr:MAG: site-specific DNA-methyltransferase [Candidatus Viridilinea halotolerans]